MISEFVKAAWEVVAALSAFAGIVILVVRHRHRPRVTSDQELVPPSVREASHDLSNESTKLRAVARLIRRSHDPFETLERAMRGKSDDAVDR